MHKRSLIAGAIFAGSSVALGAFGAHGLGKITTDPSILHGFQTGVQYQLYHALALLIAGILMEQFRDRWMKWASSCFITGILLFSGSLYGLTFLKIQEVYRAHHAAGRCLFHCRMGFPAYCGSKEKMIRAGVPVW